LSEFLKQHGTEASLVFEELIVHFPEFTLGARKLSSFGGGLCLRVNLVHREIPEDKAQPFAEVFLHALDDGIGTPAMGALIVSILDEGAGGVVVTLGVILRVRWDFQHGHGNLLILEMRDFGNTLFGQVFYLGNSSRA
jgi:hypothetical protein